MNDPISRELDRLGEYLERQLDQRLRATNIIRIHPSAPFQVRGEYFTDGTIRSRVARINLRLIAANAERHPAPTGALTLLINLEKVDRNYTQTFYSIAAGNPCQADDYDRLRQSSKERSP